MACPSVAAFLSIHNMCARMIDAHGSPEMRARVLPGAVAMTTLLSYCLTEPGSGSDAAALRSRATPTPEGYSLSGAKAFISGGGYSDAYVVMARTGEDGPRGISALLAEGRRVAFEHEALTVDEYRHLRMVVYFEDGAGPLSAGSLPAARESTPPAAPASAVASSA